MLIHNWKKCWKLFSVQAMTIGLAISSTYGMMYEQLKDTIPPSCMAIITACVFLIGIFARIKKQGGNDDA